MAQVNALFLNDEVAGRIHVIVQLIQLIGRSNVTLNPDTIIPNVLRIGNAIAHDRWMECQRI